MGTVLTLRNVGFRYSDEGPWVLRDVNLSIPRGSCVGIIGRTGGGKSTLLDLFMVLLSPNEGEILIDGRPLDDSCRRAWQMNIAHVPQTIFLADTNVAENIAFSSPHRELDMHRIETAARRSQLAGFIEQATERYDTEVGERGVRLSGGQRQRIGIARALYKRAPVLVLDEATNALDMDTEDRVMQAIAESGQDVTMLIVSHRHSILRSCDNVYSLEPGGKLRNVKLSELEADTRPDETAVLADTAEL